MASHIEKIESWLKELGLSASIDRIPSNSHRLCVSLKTDKGTRYKLYFEQTNDVISFESLVFKMPCGLPENVNEFLKVLLTFNGSVINPPIAFSIIKIDSKKWRISLKGSQECSRFNKEYLRSVLDIFDEAYSDYIPKIKSLASETVSFGDEAPFLDLWIHENFEDDI